MGENQEQATGLGGERKLHTTGHGLRMQAQMLEGGPQLPRRQMGLMGSSARIQRLGRFVGNYQLACPR